MVPIFIIVTRGDIGYGYIKYTMRIQAKARVLPGSIAGDSGCAISCTALGGTADAGGTKYSAGRG